MRQLYLLLIFSVTIYAENINLSLINHNGESSYIVDSDNIQNLKSKLIFPFNFNSIDLEYQYKLKYFNLSLSTSIILNSKITKGEDYDWQNNNLTVYSKSDNKIDKYYKIAMELSRDLSSNIDLFTKFSYQVLNMFWSNTYQKDYIKNSDEYIIDDSLKFQQEFYKYNLGVVYKKNITKKLSLEFIPSLTYTYINSQDIHILRDFYTIQNIKSFGYDIGCKLDFQIEQKSNLLILFNYSTQKGKNIDMDYYNELNQKYLSYPSSYYHKDIIIGIKYNYEF